MLRYCECSAFGWENVVELIRTVWIIYNICDLTNKQKSVLYVWKILCRKVVGQDGGHQKDRLFVETDYLLLFDIKRRYEDFKLRSLYWGKYGELNYILYGAGTRDSQLKNAGEEEEEECLCLSHVIQQFWQLAAMLDYHMSYEMEAFISWVHGFASDFSFI